MRVRVRVKSKFFGAGAGAGAVNFQNNVCGCGCGCGEFSNVGCGCGFRTRTRTPGSGVDPLRATQRRRLTFVESTPMGYPKRRRPDSKGSTQLEGLSDMTLVQTAFSTLEEHVQARLSEAWVQNVQD